jgi:dipeptidyl aminopeptidase/acylaminoacyl peptidase
MAQPFDASALRLSGEAMPVAEKVDLSGTSSSALFSVSNNGVLAYLSGSAGVNTQLTWFDLEGKNLGTVGPPAGRLTVALSPNGAFAAEDRQDVVTGSFHLWLHDLAHGTDSRVSASEKWESYPVWSPDSRSLVYMTAHASGNELYVQPATGSGKAELLFTMTNLYYATDWSRDGRFIAFTVSQSDRAGQIWVLPVADGKPGKPFPFVATGNESHGRFSPDGNWFAYVSNQTSRPEIYVTRFPDKRESYRVSTQGGSYPVWDPGGRRLFYSGPDGSIMQVDVVVGTAFQFGIPRPLFRVMVSGYNTLIVFAVSPDGKRILVRAPAESSTKAQLNVIVNWPSLLKK